LLAAGSVHAYIRDIRGASIQQLRAAQWTKEVTDVLYLYNPRATNYWKADSLLRQISSELQLTPIAFDITRHQKRLERYLANCHQQQVILVAIGGGDGSLNSVVNLLLQRVATKHAPRPYILPLWGGNANDFACMLNGLRVFTGPKQLLSKSAAVPIPLVKLRLAQPGQTSTQYACCYASFGASAYAARQLDSKRFSSRRFVRNFPPILLLRELFLVTEALLAAPLQAVMLDEQETKFYEHTIVKGSRIAKVNRIPIELDEPAFFHALVTNKNPSVIISVIRILLRKPDAQYSKKDHLSFTTKADLYTQIDGEASELPANTTVTASIVQTQLRFISTHLVKP
jgi:diacylglycerol kinase family enzyme